VRLSADEAQRRFVAAPSARMATVAADGAPRIVPVVFAYVDGALVHVVDHKPKSTKDLGRLRDITAEPRVSFLVDAYDADWTRLWWARADALASVLEPSVEPDACRRAVDALAERYPQYREVRPGGPVVAAKVIKWSGWAAASSAAAPADGCP
jgi:PPOX class probable F420-dependent enzyme